MTVTWLRLALPVLLLVAAPACGEPGAEIRSGGAVPNGPWGRTFLSTAVSEDGQDRPLVEGTRIRLDFRPEGRLGAHAGCNSMGGEADVVDGHLVVADLATTEMGCDPARHDQDGWLAGFLTSRPVYRLDGPVLMLRHGSTELRLEDREVSDPDRPLRGTRWVVDAVVDGDAVSSVPAGAEAHLVIDGEQDRFGGSTGCNQMGGTVRPEEATVTFSDVISTKMACDEDRMRLEESVLSVLDGEVAWEIEADVLRLTHPGGRGLDLRAGG